MDINMIATMDINMIVTMDYGHLCPMEENLCSDNGFVLCIFSDIL
jgi:hypothetical protein